MTTAASGTVIDEIDAKPVRPCTAGQTNPTAASRIKARSRSTVRTNIDENKPTESQVAQAVHSVARLNRLLRFTRPSGISKDDRASGRATSAKMRGHAIRPGRSRQAT